MKPITIVFVVISLSTLSGCVTTSTTVSGGCASKSSNLQSAKCYLERSNDYDAYMAIEESLDKTGTEGKEAINFVKSNSDVLKKGLSSFSKVSLTNSTMGISKATAAGIQKKRLSLFKVVATEQAYYQAAINYNEVFPGYLENTDDLEKWNKIIGDEIARIGREKERAFENKVHEMQNANIVNINKFDFNKFYGKKHRSHGSERGEFETKEAYIKRLKSVVDPDVIYYFDVKTKLPRYDLENQSYKLPAPEVMRDIPTAYSSSVKDSFEYVDPRLVIGRYDDRRARYIWLLLKEDEKRKTYDGSNAFGVKAKVVDTKRNEWGLAFVFDEFNTMEQYRRNLVYKKGKYDFQDAIRLEIPTEEAKELGLSKTDIIVRVGVKFTYGVRDLALATDFADGHEHTPTVSEPWITSGYTYILGADLDSLCLLKQKNNEVISCRFR